MSIQDFIDRVAGSYGNPNAVFLPVGQRLRNGQLIKVFLCRNRITDCELLCDATATGQNTAKGEHLVKVKTKYRTWTVKAGNNQILINW